VWRIRLTVVAVETQQCFPFYWCWLVLVCSCQQYKIVECCQGNATVRSFAAVVELQSILCCCQQYT